MINFFSENWLIHRIEDNAISSAISKYASGKLIDIGCADKKYAKMISSFVTKHIGLDYKNTLHDKSKIDILATAYRIPSKDGKFNTVLCTFVLEHLEEPDKAIREAYRVLKKNGYAIYTVPLFWHLHEEPRDFYRFTKYGLKYLFEKNGFKIIELKVLSGFWITFGQEFVYYLWCLRKGGKLNPLWWIIPFMGTIIQGISLLLDKIHHPGQFTCEYLIVAKKN